jgi:hypothetical protein
MNKEPKLQFSKFLTLGSLCLFIWSLLQGFSTDFTQVYDTTVYVTAITISGGIFGVCLKSYMGKSKAENVYKIQKTIYEEIMNVKLQYNEAMMKLIQTYHLTQDDVNMFDSDSPINDGVNDILNDMRENVNNHLYDVKSEDDIENF